MFDCFFLQGIVEVGGIGEVWDIANEWDRLDFFV